MAKMFDSIPDESLRKNLEAVRSRIGAAAAKSGRSADSIRLIAVTKYVRSEEIKLLASLGVADFGEARVQDAEKKTGDAARAGISGLRWHLIGHLQTNKADKAAKIFQTIHSVDSPRVAQALNKEALKRGAAPLSCLLEVNVAGEESKFGLKPDLPAILELLKVCGELPGIRVSGLMTMAPYADNPEPVSRPVFRRLRELLEEANVRRVYSHAMSELSMGMSQDFEIAIEEGSTYVRVGSALFTP
jgi:pyridoxal phosphate enzyme (YggS family)